MRLMRKRSLPMAKMGPFSISLYSTDKSKQRVRNVKQEPFIVLFIRGMFLFF